MYFKLGDTGMELSPTHRSHKTVAAVKILTIQYDNRDGFPITRLIFDGIPSVELGDAQLANKPIPQAGMYLVVYEDGYFSFSPAKQFEEGYTAISGQKETQGIGWAVAHLRNGWRIRRAGWNGKGMFLFLVAGSTFKVNRPPLLGIYAEGTEVNYCPHVDLKNADGKVVPWNASQGDLLATDWELAE